MAQDHSFYDIPFYPERDMEDILEDIEECLLALKTFFSGDGADDAAAQPDTTVTEAGMPFLPIANKTIMKQRDKANSSWLTLWELEASGVPKAYIDNHIDQDITENNQIHGIKQGHGGGIDLDKVDGYEASALIPLVHSSGYFDYAGTTSYVEANTERTTENTVKDAEKKKEITFRALPVDDYIRVSVDLKSSDSANTVYGDLRRNGETIHTFTSTSTSYETLTTDVDITLWNDGDIMSLYLSNDGSGYTAYVRNFKVLFVPAVSATTD